ncbi:MAG TPA: NAD(P)-dependent oxidoreductase [Gemmatimonadales bacterium]|nr:NAD(P)-dependent oxidoreductase [Gemmatimonadales bacterium]
MRLAVLGLGAMGAPIARNLVHAGFDVAVWNRTAERAREVPGARAARSPAAACEGVDVALTMLADDAAVEQVIFGRDGVLGALPRGSCHVGMSTISTALSRRLADAHAQAGQGFVAAPVFGRPEAAAARLLWIVAGGARADLDRCEPVFAAIGQGTFRFADAPRASLAKLLGNFLIAANVEILGEALVAAEKAGLEPARLLEVLTRTLFGSPVVERYGRLVADTAFEPAGFRLSLGLKDVELALRAADELGAPLPVAALLRERFLAALAAGREHYDWAGIASVIREDAGLPPVRSRTP